MAGKTSTSRRRKFKSNARKRLNLQKPNGVIGPRVAKGGGRVFVLLFTTLYSIVLVPTALISLIFREHGITSLGALFIGERH